MTIKKARSLEAHVSWLRRRLWCSLRLPIVHSLGVPDPAGNQCCAHCGGRLVCAGAIPGPWSLVDEPGETLPVGTGVLEHLSGPYISDYVVAVVEDDDEVPGAMPCELMVEWY